MTGDVLLEVRGVSISFGALRAVQGIDLEVRRGQVTSVIGPNGAGKSTLFNLISGNLSPSAGYVALEGRRLSGRPVHEISVLGLGRSFQITNLFFDLTVMENLLVAAQVLEPRQRLLRDPRFSGRAQARAEQLLHQFGLAAKERELAGHLSHGEQRRLEIAVSLAAEPRLLLLDEPTQGMAHEDTAETAALIRRLAEDITILLIEHDVGLVMDISDHVMVMHMGRKLAEGTPSQIRADERVLDAYLGRG
ncbi:MAG: ABC transporter ATP-binding protein [Tistlia sp.]|uniref:ABC transporter ATP-binding protein n=1 Tax=Tistlia sp. TaxID=3057121 RepID=UPI0034A1AF82